MRFTEISEAEREDLLGYVPYDVDNDRRLETWGLCNIHHEWSFSRVGRPEIETSGEDSYDVPFSCSVRRAAVTISRSVEGNFS